MSGKLIVLEGIDGSGKSTQAELLRGYIRSLNREVLMTREPGGCSISEQIRGIILDKNNAEMYPLTEAYLYAAARAQHVREIIAPALADGKIVICDRFVVSSYAYQGYGRGLGAELIAELNRPAVDGVRAELTVLFDLPTDAAHMGEELDRLESAGGAFMSRVRQGYLALADERFLLVDANGSVEEIHQKIIQRVRELL